MFVGHLAPGQQAGVVIDVAGISDVIANSLNQAHRLKWPDTRAASTDGLCWVCVGADYQDIHAGVFLQRQQAAFIFEQNCAFARRVKGNLIAFAVVTRNYEVGLFAIEPAEADCHAKYAANFVIDGRH